MGKKKKKPEVLYFHFPIYGIFDRKNKDILKISMDREEIEMELAVTGLDDNLCECEFTITLTLTP